MAGLPTPVREPGVVGRRITAREGRQTGPKDPYGESRPGGVYVPAPTGWLRE